MAGQQLGALSRHLLEAGWPADTPVLVTSRAGCADALFSDHTVSLLGSAGLLHKGRPTVVTVGVGARPVVSNVHKTPAFSGLRTDMASVDSLSD